MTYFHYYATTSRNLDRAVQYGLYPLAHAMGLYIFRNSSKHFEHSANFARLVSAAGYASLTTTFFGLESEMIDANSREAVSAEMGINPDKVVFSDYKYSKNAIVNTAYKDIIRLQKYRYGTDSMFLVPTLLRWGAEACGITYPRMKDVRENPKKYSLASTMVNGHNAWDFGVYAGKAVYWAGETYLIPKTGNYEIVKLRENLQSTSKDITYNDLLAVYQRARSDRKLPLIENDSPEEQKAIHIVLDRMAKAYNRHDGKFGISEIVYLIGLGKVDIHGPDNVTVSQEAVEKSLKEIDKVIAVGLDGIREENRRKIGTLKYSKTFTDNIADGAFNVVQRIMGNKPSSIKRVKTEEYITVRDPGELTSGNSLINR